MILLVIICLFVMVTEWTGLGCPLRRLLGFPCPTCGVTRAMFSLVRLDFAAYFAYQPMALPLCAAVLLMLNLDLWRHKRIVTAVAVAVAVANMGLYLWRLLA